MGGVGNDSLEQVMQTQPETVFRDITKLKEEEALEQRRKQQEQTARNEEVVKQTQLAKTMQGQNATVESPLEKQQEFDSLLKKRGITRVTEEEAKKAKESTVSKKETELDKKITSIRKFAISKSEAFVEKWAKKWSVKGAVPKPLNITVKGMEEVANAATITAMTIRGYIIKNYKQPVLDMLLKNIKFNLISLNPTTNDYDPEPVDYSTRKLSKATLRGMGGNGGSEPALPLATLGDSAVSSVFYSLDKNKEGMKSVALSNTHKLFFTETELPSEQLYEIEKSCGNGTYFVTKSGEVINLAKKQDAEKRIEKLAEIDRDKYEVLRSVVQINSWKETLETVPKVSSTEKKSDAVEPKTDVHVSEEKKEEKKEEGTLRIDLAKVLIEDYAPEKERKEKEAKEEKERKEKEEKALKEKEEKERKEKEEKALREKEEKERKEKEEKALREKEEKERKEKEAKEEKERKEKEEKALKEKEEKERKEKEEKALREKEEKERKEKEEKALREKEEKERKEKEEKALREKEEKERKEKEEKALREKEEKERKEKEEKERKEKEAKQQEKARRIAELKAKKAEMAKKNEVRKAARDIIAKVKLNTKKYPMRYLGTTGMPYADKEAAKIAGITRFTGSNVSGAFLSNMLLTRGIEMSAEDISKIYSLIYDGQIPQTQEAVMGILPTILNQTGLDKKYRLAKYAIKGKDKKEIADKARMVMAGCVYERDEHDPDNEKKMRINPTLLTLQKGDEKLELTVVFFEYKTGKFKYIDEKGEVKESRKKLDSYVKDGYSVTAEGMELIRHKKQPSDAQPKEQSKEQPKEQPTVQKDSIDDFEIIDIPAEAKKVSKEKKKETKPEPAAERKKEKTAKSRVKTEIKPEDDAEDTAWKDIPVSDEDLYAVLNEDNEEQITVQTQKPEILLKDYNDLSDDEFFLKYSEGKLAAYDELKKHKLISDEDIAADIEQLNEAEYDSDPEIAKRKKTPEYAENLAKYRDEAKRTKEAYDADPDNLELMEAYIRADNIAVHYARYGILPED